MGINNVPIKIVSKNRQPAISENACCHGMEAGPLSI
jgi:hypothetical protein